PDAERLNLTAPVPDPTATDPPATAPLAGEPSALLASSRLHFLQASPDPQSLGRLGPYEVLEVVGEGGMGIVLKAFDPSLKRIVAVKCLSPSLAIDPLARRSL